MSQLQNNLREILRQKNRYLLPENLKKDVTVLGVTGTLDPEQGTVLDVGEGDISISGNTLIFDYLPYIELEYIEGTGTQYISTDYRPNSNTRLELEFGDISAPERYQSAVILSASSVFANVKHFLLGAYDLRFTWSGTSASGGSVFSGSYSGKHILTINNNILTFDGNTVVNDTSTDFVDLTFLTLFASLANLNSPNFGRYKLYSFKIYENNSLVRDFIPVGRKSDFEICLYDLITNAFFTNTGTGTFIAGPVKGGNN